MKAYLRSARIAPKKAAIIAAMVRGLPVPQALDALQHMHKKGARMIEQLLKSAVANAEHNDKQNAALLTVKTIVVNQGTGYRRGVPMARGRVRPMTKFLSHIDIVLGVAGGERSTEDKNPKKPKTTTNPMSTPRATSAAGTKKNASQKGKNTVQRTRSTKRTDHSSDSSVSSDSSISS